MNITATHGDYQRSAARRRRRRFPSLIVLAGFALIGAPTHAQFRPDPGRYFEELDTNDDGVVEQRELDAARRAAFDRADADDDDYVSGAELEALRVERRGALSGPAGLRGARAMRQRAGESAQARAEALDTDGDGRIAESEYLAAPHGLLERFDADADGRITRAEMDEGRAELREQLRRPR